MYVYCSVYVVNDVCSLRVEIYIGENTEGKSSNTSILHLLDFKLYLKIVKIED